MYRQSEHKDEQQHQKNLIGYVVESGFLVSGSGENVAIIGRDATTENTGRFFRLKEKTRRCSTAMNVIICAS